MTPANQPHKKLYGMPHKKNKWIIVFLIYADFRIDPKIPSDRSFDMIEEMKVELNAMFGDIITVPMNNEAAELFVILDGINYIPDPTVTAVTETKTLFYKVVNEGESFNRFDYCRVIQKTRSPTGDRPPEQPSQNSERLAEIFGEIEFDEEDEIFLITWDHGSAFGIFRETDPVDVAKIPAEIRKPIYMGLNRFPYLKMFWDCAMSKEPFKTFMEERMAKPAQPILQFRHSLFRINTNNVKFGAKAPEQDVYSFAFEQRLKEAFAKVQHLPTIAALPAAMQDMGVGTSDISNDKVREILKNQELADALQRWLKDKKVGVLMMMNCWMMNLHTMYDLKDVVCCLVAPQGGISNPGYNYRDILQYIYRKKKPMIPQNLAVKCVKYSENTFAKRRAKKLKKDKPDTIDFWKIFAADLQTEDSDDLLFDKQIAALKDFILILEAQETGLPHIPTEMKWLCKYVRSVCFDFSDNKAFMIDVTNWIRSILSADELFVNKRSLFQPVRDAGDKLKDLIMSKQGEIFLMLAESKGKRVYAFDDTKQAKPVIQAKPTGYSLFFPAANFSEKPNLSADVKTDRFLNGFLSCWKDFLDKHIGITFPVPDPPAS